MMKAQIAKRSLQSEPASQPFRPLALPLQDARVQRSARCSCGGSCPRCSPTHPEDAGVVQRKPEISSPTDPYEHEADDVADRVLRMAEPASVTSAGAALQRKCRECQDDTSNSIQPKRVSGSDLQTTLDVAEAARSALRGGAPLSSQLRSYFEPRFGYDFSRVQIHDDGGAAAAASAVQARAYTFGRNIVFGAGEYAPATASGKRLLAHELTHVVQQGAADTTAQRAPSATRKSEGVAPHAIQRQELMPIEPPAMPEFFDVPPEVELEPEMSPEVGPEMGPEVGPDVGPELGPEVGPQTTEPNPNPIPFVLPQPDVDVAPEQGVDEDEPDSDCGSRKMPFTVVTATPGPRGQGGLVEASPLSRCAGNTRGSLASPAIYRPQFDCINAAGQGRQWVRAHVLHGATRRRPLFNLHGPGNVKWNLIIADVGLNGEMSRKVEDPVINRIHLKNDVMWYRSQVTPYVDPSVPGLDYFAQSITVDYGTYDTNTGSKGPREGGDKFSLTPGRTPPTCPAGTGFAVVPPGISPPGSHAAAPGVTAAKFRSTFEICLRQKQSRSFHVSDGGVQLRIGANWMDKAGNLQRQSACPGAHYTVTLWKDNPWWPDGEMGHVAVPVGRNVVVKWRRLLDGDYYFIIQTSDTSPACCLNGEISVGTFSAPRPQRGTIVMA